MENKNEEVKNNLTELVFILDASGSMSGLEADTIGGFNSMIEKQKKEEGECLVSTVIFDNASRVLHDRVSIEKIEKLTENDYYTGGCTALMDAIGGAIHHIGNVHRYARKEDVPASTLFVITTDGMENASREYSSDKVKKLIKEKEELGWKFLFIAANIDAVDTAARMGIRKEYAVDYVCDAEGTAVLYDSVGKAVSHMRKNRSIAPECMEAIREDYNRRAPKHQPKKEARDGRILK